MTIDVQNDINALSCIGNISPSVLSYNYIDVCSRLSGGDIDCPIIISNVSVPYCGYQCVENACPIILLHADINLLPTPYCKLECYRCINVTSKAFVYYNYMTCSGDICSACGTSASGSMWRHVHHTGAWAPSLIYPTCSVAHMFDPLTLDWTGSIGYGRTVTCINCVVLCTCLSVGRCGGIFYGNVCTTAQAIILNGTELNKTVDETYKGSCWQVCTIKILPCTYNVNCCIRS